MRNYLYILSILVFSAEDLYSDSFTYNSFNNNGVVYGDGANALDVTATPGGADATTSFQILSASASNGVPVWTTSIDGGTY